MSQITETNVKGALNALYTGSKDNTSLLNLRLVDALRAEMELQIRCPLESMGVTTSWWFT